jgi:PKHD-type hydroxylase
MQLLFKPKILNNYSEWAFYNDVFDKDECENIKTLFKNPEKSTVTRGDDPAVDYSDTRSSLVSWVPYNKDVRWIYERISNFVHDCNNSRYGFDIVGFNEPLQLAKYEIGDYFDWHQDMGRDVSWRKLSIVVQLSDPSEYEGGQLEFLSRSKFASNKLGSLIIFPSYMSHKVTPITGGTRYSLVAWISGPPYR